MDYENLDNVDTFATRLKWARKQNGLTQISLARKANMSQSAIASYEAGVRSLNGETGKIVKLARVLGINADWLSCGVGSPHATEQEIIEYKVKEKVSSWPFSSNKEEVENLPPHYIEQIDNYISSLLTIWKKDRRTGPKK